jgi:hypothetical protein
MVAVADNPVDNVVVHIVDGVVGDRDEVLRLRT